MIYGNVHKFGGQVPLAGPNSITVIGFFPFSGGNNRSVKFSFSEDIIDLKLQNI